MFLPADHFSLPSLVISSQSLSLVHALSSDLLMLEYSRVQSLALFFSPSTLIPLMTTFRHGFKDHWEPLCCQPRLVSWIPVLVQLITSPLGYLKDISNSTSSKPNFPSFFPNLFTSNHISKTMATTYFKFLKQKTWQPPLITFSLSHFTPNPLGKPVGSPFKLVPKHDVSHHIAVLLAWFKSIVWIILRDSNKPLYCTVLLS